MNIFVSLNYNTFFKNKQLQNTKTCIYLAWNTIWPLGPSYFSLRNTCQLHMYHYSPRTTLLYNYLPGGPSVGWCHGRPAPGAAFCVSIFPSWPSHAPHPWPPSASLPLPVSSSDEQIKSYYFLDHKPISILDI